MDLVDGDHEHTYSKPIALSHAQPSHSDGDGPAHDDDKFQTTTSPHHGDDDTDGAR